MDDINEIVLSQGIIETNFSDFIKNLEVNYNICGSDGNDIIDWQINGELLTKDQVNNIDFHKGVEINYNLENFNLTFNSPINNSSNNTIAGNEPNKIISGDAFDDILFGGAGNDLLIGQAGNDQLDGGDGNDTLIGSSSYAIGMVGEVDTLTGGAGADTFSLVASDGSPAYIFDGDSLKGGYAIISDFKLDQGDKIRLDGLASDYKLVGSAKTTDLFYIGPKQDKFELVARIEGVNFDNSALNTPAFQYV